MLTVIAKREQRLFHASCLIAFAAFGCVLQYTRSGRIAVTRGMQEQVSEFLEQREQEQ